MLSKIRQDSHRVIFTFCHHFWPCVPKGYFFPFFLIFRCVTSRRSILTQPSPLFIKRNDFLHYTVKSGFSGFHIRVSLSIQLSIASSNTRFLFHSGSSPPAPTTTFIFIYYEVKEHREYSKKTIIFLQSHFVSFLASLFWKQDKVVHEGLQHL